MKALFYCTAAILWLTLAACQRDDTPTPATSPWQEVATPVILNNPQGLYFVDEETGWFYGWPTSNLREPGMLHTVDGGTTWKFIDLSSLSISGFRAFCPVNNQLIYACGVDLTSVPPQPDRPIYKSTNGGDIWQKLPSLGLDGSFALHFFDEQVGISANTNVVQRTSDGGQSWSTVYETPGFGGLNRLEFPSPTTGYAAGGLFFDATNAGTLLKTTDGGQNWQELPWSYGCITTISFLSPELGFVSTTTSGLLRTTDGGRSWQTISINAPSSDIGGFTTPLIGYLSHNNTLWRSTDGGHRWQADYTLADTKSIFTGLCFPTPTLGFAVNRNGTLLKKITP